MEIPYSQDYAVDYCKYTYAVTANPLNYHSINLLYRFLALYDLCFAELIHNTINAILPIIGVQETVWGLKKRETGYSVEFYFYGDAYMQTKVSTLLEKYFKFNPHKTIPTNPGLFMTSLEISSNLIKPENLEEVQYYLRSVLTKKEYSGGFSYSLTKTGLLTRQNAYNFFDLPEHQSQFLHDVKNSFFTDFSQVSLQNVINESFLKCKTACHSYKTQSDGLYFSRIGLETFLIFLKQFEYPEPFIEYIRQEQAHYAYLLFDIGYDYYSPPNNSGVAFPKSSFYGFI
jgi:hypothetical protein